MYSRTDTIEDIEQRGYEEGFEKAKSEIAANLDAEGLLTREIQKIINSTY